MIIKDKIEQILFIEKMNSEYFTPQEIKYKVPSHLDSEETVALALELRKQHYTSLQSVLHPLLNNKGEPFVYWETPKIKELASHVLSQAVLMQGTPLVKSEAHETLLFEQFKQTLANEAFYSSTIEGAKTTRRRAIELSQGAKPTDKSEQMCLNNFETLDYLIKKINTPLTHELICEINNRITKNTLSDEDAPYGGRYRDDMVYIYENSEKKVHYSPPPANKVEDMMTQLINWANHPPSFGKPVFNAFIEASIIHFYIGYVHPFFDGNGRTARALVYYYLLKWGFDFMRLVSISEFIFEAKKQYYKAFLDTEESENDLTYFILYSLKLFNTIFTTTREAWNKTDHIGFLIEKLKKEEIHLNPKQTKFISMMIRKNMENVDIQKYQKIIRCSYETARSELTDLVDKKILKMQKMGHKFLYSWA